MPRIRRPAREIALKTLFQVDVGKQPLSDAFESGLANLRENVTSAVEEVAVTAGAQVLDFPLPLESVNAPQRARQIRASARAIASRIRSLIDRASEHCSEAVREGGDFNHDAASERFARDCAKVTESIAAEIARPSPFPRYLEALGALTSESVPRVQAVFAKSIVTAARIGEYASRLIAGTTERRRELDQRLSDLVGGWSPERQAAVDRNILRIAAFEILFEPEVSAATAINEAVELAQKYSTEDSGRFVNGVLGALESQGIPV